MAICSAHVIKATCSDCEALTGLPWLYICLYGHLYARRIDQRSLPLDSRYTFSGTSAAAGAGVFIYILDSGVRWNHTFFQGRGRAGTFWPYVGVSNELDNNGHGSHVVSVAGCCSRCWCVLAATVHSLQVPPPGAGQQASALFCPTIWSEPTAVSPKRLA
jgi:subtilisin family serine protease